MVQKDSVSTFSQCLHLFEGVTIEQTLQVNTIDFYLINQVQRLMHQNVLGIKMKSFHFMKVLGKGNWGTVYEAFDQKTNINVAVKAIPKIFMKQTPKLEELVRTQIRVLRDCKNENVIKLVDYFFSDRTQFIVTEYCDGGDLEDYLNKKTRLTQDQATTFLKQILNGFRGLHQVNAMHRDFKAANILLHQGVCKIADLGFAKQMEKKSVTKTILGTSLTMAPELLRQKEYGMQADIWSVGVVYYQLLYGKYPFVGLSDSDILKSIEKSKPDFSGVNISANSRDFIERCLTDNPQKRISWLQIYKHPLIQTQEKMLYVLSSKININENIDFYNQDIKIKEEYIYAEKKGMKKKETKEDIVVAQKVDMNRLIVENEQKKKVMQLIQKYQKAYLNKRNNIMFIFKFVTPYIYNLYNIRANHGITLFILTKKAYHDIKCFVHFVSNKRDFLKLREHFEQFTHSPKYQAILDLINTDLEIIKAQLLTYREDIEHCSSEIRKEFDIEGIFSQHWGILVQQTIQSYEFELGQNLDKLKGERKIDLIKVVEALIYFRSSATADVESFDRKIETLNYQLAQGNLRARFDALFH